MNSRQEYLTNHTTEHLSTALTKENNWQEFLDNNPSQKSLLEVRQAIADSGVCQDSHPSCGFYSWLLGEIAVRLS